MRLLGLEIVQIILELPTLMEVVESIDGELLDIWIKFTQSVYIMKVEHLSFVEKLFYFLDNVLVLRNLIWLLTVHL